MKMKVMICLHSMLMLPSCLQDKPPILPATELSTTLQAQEKIILYGKSSLISVPADERRLDAKQRQFLMNALLKQTSLIDFEPSPPAAKKSTTLYVHLGPAQIYDGYTLMLKLDNPQNPGHVTLILEPKDWMSLRELFPMRKLY